MAHSICHIELGATDVKRTSGFYESVFDWKFSNAMGDEYLTFDTGQGLGGGLYKTPEVKSGGGIVFYILVNDIDASMSKITGAGGQQKIAKTEIPNVGWYGQFADPEGNLIGLFTPKA